MNPSNHGCRRSERAASRAGLVGEKTPNDEYFMCGSSTSTSSASKFVVGISCPFLLSAWAALSSFNRSCCFVFGLRFGTAPHRHGLALSVDIGRSSGVLRSSSAGPAFIDTRDAKVGDRKKLPSVA